MQRSVWNDIVSWHTRRLNNSTKYVLHASMTTTSKKKKWNLLENCQKYHVKLFNCLCLARVGRPDILWSMNKLARSITEWTKPCDKRLSRLIYYIHHTCEYKQYCYVGNTAKQCRLGPVSRLRFCRRSWGLKIYFGWNIVRFGKSYICSNKLDVQETNFSFTQFNRPVNEQTWNSFNTSHNSKTKAISRSDQWFGQCWFYSLKRYFFSSGSFVVHIWRQRSSDQDDHKGKEPDNETCFQKPQSCSWLVFWSNHFGLQNPNQIHWHQKPTRRHTDQGKLHTWWMEPFFVLVYIQPFQFYRLFGRNVEKNAKRLRWRKSRSKIEADDEFDLATQRKDSWRAIFYCIRKSGKPRHESQLPLSPQTEKYDRTVRPVVYAYSSSYSSQEWKSDELMEVRTRRPVHEQPPGLFAEHTGRFIVDDDGMDSGHRRRIRHVVKIQIILAQGEWSSAKDSRPIFKRYKHKTATNILWYGECFCLQHWKHLYSWGRLTWKIYIPSIIQKISQWNRCSTYLKNWYPNNQMRFMEWVQLTGKTLHGSIYLWLVM